MAGYGFSGVGAGPAFDQGFYPGGVFLPPSHLDERTHNGADHVAQEPVGPNSEIPVFRGAAGRVSHHLEMGRRVGLPVCFVDGADGGFVVSAGFFEAGKIMCPEKVSAGFVHRVEIDLRKAALPGMGRHERVFPAMDEVGIFTSCGAEAGVHVRLHRINAVDRHAAG